jgi:hypothetical protein
MSYLQLWLLALLAQARDGEQHAEYVVALYHELYGCEACHGGIPTISN